MLIFRLNVNQALSLLEENLPRFLEADLFILPPDPVFSDAGIDDEDKPKSVNHLSFRQLSLPTEAVFRTAYQESKIFEYEEDDARVLKAKSPPSKKKAAEAKKVSQS